MREVLTLAAIERMDHGKVGAMVKSHVAKCVADINDRPADQTARRVVLEMFFTPTGSDGTVEDVKVSFACKSNVPANRTREYSMEPDGQDRLLFNDASRTNVKQGTLDEAGGGKRPE